MVGRTDVPLAQENLNYKSAALVPQGTLLRSVAASQQAAGNTIDTVSISLGFNELAALASSPSTALAKITPTLAAYRSNYSAVLSEVRDLAPSAHLFLLNYYNPFPADPTSPAAPIFNADGPRLNAVIKELATKYHAAYVDTATPFIGHEAAYTYLDEMPHGSTVPPPFGGVLPIGNVHPNGAGYDVIAAQVAASSPTAVPLPPALVSTAPVFALMLGVVWMRRRRATA